MTNILYGKKIFDEQIGEIQSQISLFSRKPKLAIIVVGNNEASKTYIKNKIKHCNDVGIETELFKFENTTDDEIISLINKLNLNKSIDSILVQLPLTPNLNTFNILESIDYKKDVDGFTSKNKGLLESNQPNLVSCTAIGIVELLKFYKIKIENKNVTIIGTTQVVGLPLSKLLLNERATITLCNINTKNLIDHTKNADIIISATGVKNLITKDMVKKNSTIISVGLKKENDIFYGDANFEQLNNYVDNITPIVGGVGPLTILNLLKNIILCHKMNI